MCKGSKWSISNMCFNLDFNVKLGLASGLFSIHYSFSIQYSRSARGSFFMLLIQQFPGCSSAWLTYRFSKKNLCSKKRWPLSLDPHLLITNNHDLFPPLASDPFCCPIRFNAAFPLPNNRIIPPAYTFRWLAFYMNLFVCWFLQTSAHPQDMLSNIQTELWNGIGVLRAAGEK